MFHSSDKRFMEDQIFSLVVFNNTELYENNKEVSNFFNSGKFLGQNPPTVEQLKENYKLGMIVAYKRSVITHIRSKAVTTIGRPKPKNLKAGPSITCPWDVVIQLFS